MAILLCTRGGARELPRVAAALRTRGEEPRLLDSMAFPAQLALVCDASAPVFAGVTAVWQSLAVGGDLPAMDAEARATCTTASELALAGALDALPAFQLDANWKQRRADNKVFQLAAARRIGLDVPPTLVTNDAEAVRRFAREHRPVVMKMLVQPIGDADAPVVFTTALDDTDDLDGLELCPMIFQARVPNRLDIRAVVVGDRVFAAAAASPGTEVDWRRAAIERDEPPAWQRHELPARTHGAIIELVRALELGFAAVDLIETPDGRHAFLELNAQGSFEYLGDALAAPIADAIAERLIRG